MFALHDSLLAPEVKLGAHTFTLQQPEIVDIYNSNVKYTFSFHQSNVLIPYPDKVASAVQVEQKGVE